MKFTALVSAFAFAALSVACGGSTPEAEAPEAAAGEEAAPAAEEAAPAAEEAAPAGEEAAPAAEEPAEAAEEGAAEPAAE